MKRSYGGLLLFLLLCTIGCDDNSTTCPERMGGTIEGYISDGGDDLEAEFRQSYVIFDSINDVYPSYTIETTVDSTGYYRLDVPTGKGHLYLYTRRYRQRIFYATTELNLNSEGADIVDVASGDIRADFNLGRAVLNFTIPTSLNQDNMNCRLETEDRQYGDIEGQQQGDILSFAFRLQAPGLYQPCLEMRDGYYDLPVSMLPDVDEAFVLNIETDLKQTATFTVPEPVLISGSVTGSWQVFETYPPFIGVYLEDDDILFDKKSVSSDGTFEFLDYLRRPLKLFVSISDINQWIGGVDLASARVFDTSAGQDFVGINYVEYGLSCELVYGPDILFSAASFELYDTVSPDNYFNNTYSSFDSPLKISNLQPGLYFLRIIPGSWGNAWVPRFYDGQNTLETATPIVIEASEQVKSISCSLIKGGNIQGTLSFEDGSIPLESDIYFHLIFLDIDPNMSHLTKNWTYDSTTGTYEIYGLDNGRYQLGVNVEDRARLWYPGEPFAVNGSVLEIDDLNTLSNIDWEF